MRKPTFCIYAKRKAQISFCSNCTADQRLCFRYKDSTISILLKSEISSPQHASETIKVGLYQTWPRGYKTFFMLSSAELEILTVHKY